MKNRWYDSNLGVKDLLDLIKIIPPEAQEGLSQMIINFVNVYRKSRPPSDMPISIGKDRVLGIYKSSEKRRWYDKNPALLSAMNVIATLPEEDFKNLVDGVLQTLKEYNIK